MENIPFEGAGNAAIPLGKIEIYTWNINHGAMGKNYFNMNNNPSLGAYARNIDGIIYQLTTLTNVDFILLQDIEVNTRRAAMDNQVERFKATFSDYTALASVSPQLHTSLVPFFSFHTRLFPGLLTFSLYKPVESKRYTLPAKSTWLECSKNKGGFLLARYNVSNGKQLIVINIYNAEKYSTKDSLLKSIMKQEFEKGNYVVAGGDWRLSPIEASSIKFEDGNVTTSDFAALPNDYFPQGFIQVYDKKHPTYRDVSKAYEKGKTETAIKDFFVVSPNVKIITTNALDNEFNFSSHQAVGMIIELK